MAHEFTRTAAATPAPAPAPQEDYRLPHRHTYPFLMAVHPKSWAFIETDRGYEFLPRLKYFWERPGVNGCSRVGGGDNLGAPPDSGRMQTDARKIGWALFPNDATFVLPFDILAMDDLPDHVGKGYMVRYPARGGFLYCARWDLPVVSGDGIAWKENTAQKWAVQRWLVESNQVPRPDQKMIDAILRTKQKRIERARKDPHGLWSVEDADRDEAELDAWQQTLADSNLVEELDITCSKKALLGRAKSMELDVNVRMNKAEILALIKGKK